MTLQSFDGEIKGVASVATPPADLLDPLKRVKAMKLLVDDLFDPDDNGLGLIIPAIGHSALALISVWRAFHFNNKANEVEIPTVLSEERVIAVGDYKRFKTQEKWSYITAINLALTSLPFWYDLTTEELLIGKIPIAGVFIVSAAFFFSNGISSGNEADDILNKLETQFSQNSKERETYWGKYQEYLEEEKFSFINAAISLVAAIEVWLWYNRNDKKRNALKDPYSGLTVNLDSQKSINLALDFSYNKQIFTPQIGIVLHASF